MRLSVNLVGRTGGRMTEMTKNLLVIYEESGEEWAMYLKELLTSHLQIDDLFLYDVNCEPNEVVENLSESMWQCKLLVLTSDILKIFWENQSTNFFELLQPSHRVVLMLCGVDSPEGLYELFPFERNCQVILPDQDPEDYIFIVSNIMNEDHEDSKIKPSVKLTEISEISTSSNTGEEDVETIQSSSVLILPKRVSCEKSDELFIILSKKIPKDTEVEVTFCTKTLNIKKKPKQWSEEILYLKAPGFAPGKVTVYICYGGDIEVSTQIEYYSIVEDLKDLLLKTIDPVAFICQAFNVYTLKELDNVLMKSLKDKISSCEYNLHELTQRRTSGSSEEIPTLLHCAAKLGLKEVALLLMQSPAADCICTITNKYGEDPAKIAEKYGHLDIQAIIIQLTEKLKANQTDIPGESLRFEQEDVYEDMVDCTDHQQCSIDSCNDGTEAQADTGNETDHDAQEYGVEDIGEEEYNEEQMDYSRSDKMPDMMDDYGPLIPAENPSEPFNSDDPCLQDETYKTHDEEEEWVKSELSSEDVGDWQNTEGDRISEDSHENVCVPVSTLSITEDLPSREDYEYLMESLLPEPDRSVQPDLFQEERTDDNEHESYGELEYSDEGKDHDHNEEPLIVASTEDDMYIVFKPSVKNKLKEQSPFTSHDPPPTESASISTLECRASSSAQEEDINKENMAQSEDDEYPEEQTLKEYYKEPMVNSSTEDNVYIISENLARLETLSNPTASSEVRTDDIEIESHGELEYLDEGKDHEYNEEPLIVASTEDDMYIVFEPSVKKTQKGQSPTEVRSDDIEIESHGELEYSDEGKDHEHNEEPLIVASTEDDMYIVFEPSVKKKQRGQSPFTSHDNPASMESASKSKLECSASSSAQDVKDERFSAEFFRDEYEDDEEDLYCSIYNDDDELYIELPFETEDEQNPRGKKSFIVHRAPAPAPRPQAAVPDIDDSYISKVFRQKEEEKKIYSTGLYQDKMQLAKHEPQIPAQHYALSGQDELILLQEKVKMGIISMDEALKKFQQWQNEKSRLDLLQQKKLQQLRDNIIGDKTDDERVYDKITIVHQPNAFPGKKKTTYGMFDNSIYTKPNKPANPSTSYYPLKKDNEIAGKSPHTK
ncbi:B-cell scaffold protein with ankyrin repeats isoform 2-T3 [Anomaloglossus baeobatrachus]|uniref:B-cell scaffold protein with ankyrin repeats isoform X2 n=1 Tax=Anomaloglossus baeobatrachus TaxID=238106 RepID=UPI003F4F8C84